MPLLKPIKIYSGRIVQLKRPIGNNQQGRASDINPIIDWVNQRSDVTTAANTVTTTGAAGAQTATLNTTSGTITTIATTTTAPGTTTITVTNNKCTAASTVLCEITTANITGGVAIIQSVVPANGSFVINMSNAVALVGAATFVIKFIIL